MSNEWKRTECKRGHKYVEGSWTWSTTGNRDCKECKKIREKTKQVRVKFKTQFSKDAAKSRLANG
jgi:hypothetical protein